MISEFPGHGVRYISKLQYRCENMNFYDNSRYDKLFQQVTCKGGESAMKYIKIFQNAQALSVSVGNIYTEDNLMNIFLDDFHHSGNILHR